MSLDAYFNHLHTLSRYRSISVDARGAMTTRSLPEKDPTTALSLDLQVDPAILLASHQCQKFDATPLALPVLSTLASAGPLIDPERWGEFCEIRTEGAVKDNPPRPNGWTGTIEERIRVKVGPIVTDYHNRLRIDYRRGTDEARVDFELIDSFAGELEYEKGFLLLEPHPTMPVTMLLCSKTLLYKPSSPWCRFPATVLGAILNVWLSASMAEYALRMTKHVARDGSLELQPGVLDQVCSLLPPTKGPL